MMNTSWNQTGKLSVQLFKLLAVRLDKGFREHEVSIGVQQFAIMMHVSASGQLDMNELISILNRDSAAVTRSVKSLEQKKYLARLAHPEDKRRRIIVLTTIGFQALERAKQVEQSIIEELGNGFSREEKKSFTNLLAKAINNLKE
jgi:DNA-binding MarR family transcriptional regulator